jgi:hypothetical protein
LGGPVGGGFGWVGWVGSGEGRRVQNAECRVADRRIAECRMQIAEYRIAGSQNAGCRIARWNIEHRASSMEHGALSWNIE